MVVLCKFLVKFGLAWWHNQGARCSKWVRGFLLKLGWINIANVQVQDLRYGLMMTWNKGFKRALISYRHLIFFFNRPMVIIPSSNDEEPSYIQQECNLMLSPKAHFLGFLPKVAYLIMGLTYTGYQCKSFIPPFIFHFIF